MYKIKKIVKEIYESLHILKKKNISEKEIEDYKSEHGDQMATQKYGVFFSPMYVANHALKNIERLLNDEQVNYFDRINSLLQAWYIYDHFIVKWVRSSLGNDWTSNGENAKAIREVRKIWTHPLDVRNSSEKIPTKIASVSYSHGTAHTANQVLFTPITFDGELIGQSGAVTVSDVALIIYEYFKELNVNLKELVA